MRRVIRLGVVGAALLLVASSSARAAWTPALAIPNSAGATPLAIAVDGHGDLAVALVTAGTPSNPGVVVGVAVRRSGASSFSTHRLLSATDLAVQGVSVALDRRGETTVAWVDQRIRKGVFVGHKTIRAAFRAPTGHWSKVQAVGRSSHFFNASPRLATASNGTVALTYNADVATAPGVSAAWRTPGHPFGRAQVLTTAMRSRGYLTDPTLAFDPAGTAYLAGTLDCDRAAGRGVIYTATTRTRRFVTGRTIAPAPANSLRLAVTGSGIAIVTWLAQTCNTSEDLTGPPMAAALRHGAITPPTALTQDQAGLPTVTGAAGGAASASFLSYPAGAPNGMVATTRIGADGKAQPVVAPVDGWVPVVTDIGGDQLVRQVTTPETSPLAPIAARPAGNGPLEPAPVLAAGWPWSAGAVAASSGRALAVLSVAGRRFVATIWHP